LNILEKYAHLLVHYSLFIKKGETLLISSTTLAEPLVREVYKACIKAGAHVVVDLSFREQDKIFLDYANEEQLKRVNPIKLKMMSEFDAYLYIKAPFNLKEHTNTDQDKSKLRSQSNAEINKIYFRRTASGDMKRSLCLYPTQASAQEAGMSLSEYEHFVFNACKLFEEDPKQAWLEVRKSQQNVVDYLNKSKIIRYKNQKTDISFNVEGRTWINSDGRTNMPSGEVFTGPIEDSVNGTVYFDYPSIYKGKEVRDITLTVENGKVVKWQAGLGQDLLDSIMEIEGARYFGEVAIGTNYSITKPTKNILFDEKIGGTIHMAIGQSYIQTGGMNQSPIHWDMIAGMQEGSIYADGTKIYENGKFIF
jgi:aminopeptidase